MKNSKSWVGFLLIGLGTLFLLDSLNVIDHAWSFLWPVFLLVPAIAFHAAFFATGAKKSAAGLLVPGGILLVLSGLFFFEVLTSWQFSGTTWPFYLFAVAFGLLELWLFGGRQPSLLIPIFILTTVGSVFLFEGLIEYPIFQFWPVILIIIGLYILFGKRKRDLNTNEINKKEM
ncbi:DUF5668 domain-containing protein [Bacillus timonensis]|nr:DUF5668 domain-containing protein [Bacillus timonensis]